MPELRFEMPLKVPSGVALCARSQKRYDSGFSPSLTLDEAIAYLREEVNHFPDGAHFTVYSNYDRLADAKMRKRVSDESAVCCELEIGGKRAYFVSHQWGLTEQNIYAIHLTLRAIHNIVRWGVSDYDSLLRAFSGDSAASDNQARLGSASTVNEAELISRGQWLAILRLQDDATLVDANEAYRFYAKKAAQSEEGLLRLNQAIAAARDYFAKRS